ncbi:domain found in IF2B/IF5-domain-containing protein [Glomus cerebriforme]|uniref:Domain found in IF2B/IF5-domain-containing protein n=1 Tax=Glomus cerebriforme TaxID=658196 RepID=A0A397SQG7_9GLOM|nr:domain found in IF2B/IF5-domain-containing protein [Glomus cerebriforme]
MDTLNIGGNESDRFYRYKMPKIISKIEGKGNGIKTVVPNMSDIARSLSRPPTYPTKFFGCELGAQVKCDEKNDRYIVNGAHDATKLQELLDVFIKKFVLCAGCNNPETDLIITGKNANTQKIILDCKACGQRTDVDMRHKLVTFILKHPPTPPKGKGKKDKKSKKNGDEEAESPTSPTRGDSAEGSDDELTKRIVAEAAELPTADQDADDDNWAVDTSAEAVAERMRDLSLDVDEDGSEGEPHESFDEWLKENAGAKNNDIYKKIKELGISKETDLVLKLLVFNLFPENFKKIETVEKQINKRVKLFQKFITSADDQLALLGATEELLAQRKELMESKTLSVILMGYYQNDLLEEEVFQAWIEGSNSSKYKSLFKRNASVTYVNKAINQDIRDKAKPFAKWLEEAEEDDEDEE